MYRSYKDLWKSLVDVSAVLRICWPFCTCPSQRTFINRYVESEERKGSVQLMFVGTNKFHHLRVPLFPPYSYSSLLSYPSSLKPVGFFCHSNCILVATMLSSLNQRFLFYADADHWSVLRVSFRFMCCFRLQWYSRFVNLINFHYVIAFAPLCFQLKRDWAEGRRWGMELPYVRSDVLSIAASESFLGPFIVSELNRLSQEVA